MNLLPNSNQNRGVSEVVSWLLVFAVISSGVILIFTFGAEQLTESQTIEQDKNMERALKIFYTNNQEVYSNNAPSRSTEINLYNSSIGFSSDTVTMEAVIESKDIEYTTRSDSVVVNGANRKFKYSAHSLIRTNKGDQASQTLMIKDPSMFRYNPETNSMRIQFVGVTQTGTDSVQGGVRTIQTTNINRSNKTYELANPERIEVRITATNHIEEWRSYMEGREVIVHCTSPSSDTIICETVPVEDITLSQLDLELELQ